MPKALSPFLGYRHRRCDLQHGPPSLGRHDARIVSVIASGWCLCSWQVINFPAQSRHLLVLKSALNRPRFLMSWAHWPAQTTLQRELIMIAMLALCCSLTDMPRQFKFAESVCCVIVGKICSDLDADQHMYIC